MGPSPLGAARDDAGGGAAGAVAGAVAGGAGAGAGAGAGGGARLVWLPVDHSVRQVPSTWRYSEDIGEIRGRYRGDAGKI